MRRVTCLLLLTGVLLATAACGSSGRTLQPVPAGQTAAPRRTSTTLGVTSSTVTGLNVFSPAFEPGGRIPNEFTCNGAGISPPMSWTGVPLDATSLALAVVDQDDNGAVQWLVTGIPPTVGSATKGTPPTGGTEQPNSFGSTGWKAPCSEASHTYEFYLLAFAQAPVVDPAADPRQMVVTLQQAATNSAIFSAKFGGGKGGSSGGSSGGGSGGTGGSAGSGGSASSTTRG